MIPYGRQNITEDDIEAVVSVLKSDFLTQGPEVPRFERIFAEAVDSPHACAMSSATAGLHAAYMALGVGPGDMVWTSPNTFVATSNAAYFCGADVDFVDIDPRSLNMSTAALEAKLLAAQASGGRLPKVVVPVHFSGAPCDMAAIASLAARFGFRVVEDASHAVGARYGNGPVGNSAHSDLTVFSFHPVKIVTTGEGGLVTTRDDDLAVKLQLYRSHGITRDPRLMTPGPKDPWFYEQLELAPNYRITDIQAALGSSQMARLATFVEKRCRVAEIYHRELAGCGVGLPAVEPRGGSSWHLYVIRWPEGLGGRTRRQAFDGLRERGIGVNVHYIPVYLQPYYRTRGFEPGLCPEAEAYYAEAISLPMYPDLTDDQLGQVIESVRTLAG